MTGIAQMVSTAQAARLTRAAERQRDNPQETQQVRIRLVAEDDANRWSRWWCISRLLGKGDGGAHQPQALACRVEYGYEALDEARQGQTRGDEEED